LFIVGKRRITIVCATHIELAAQDTSETHSAITPETAIAHALVKSLYQDGRLDEHQVAAFAEAGKFDETNARSQPLPM
jgi:hypothetical protein